MAICAHWLGGYPLAFRLSSTDWIDGGLEMDETIETAKALKQAGVDLIFA